MMGLGRDSSNFIQVHDTEVSRRHAEIRREGELYTVVDLGSSNGTYVNGERIDRHQLASGDRLQVGSTLILFTDPGDTPESDLSDKIDIVMRSNAAENSRIVRTMSQQEGSRSSRPRWPLRCLLPWPAAVAWTTPAAACRSCIARPWR